jgi:propanol-preferring alcohol dehydrogenase
VRAVVLGRTGGPLRVEERPEPVPTGDQERIDVTACGVCHSDVHVVAGDYAGALPLVLGHEVTGVHAELGPVIVYACWGCRRPHCWACSSGQEMICPNSHEAGLVDDGGYAERMLVPDRSYLVPLGDLDPVHSAPLACGGLTAFRAVGHTLETLRRGGPRRALVLGAGGLGQFGLQLLRQLTDAEVVVVDTSPDKRRQATSLGAHHAVDPASLEGTFNAVVDFVGAQATLEAMVGHVARQGIGVVVGLYGGRVPFGLGAVPHEARLMSSIWGTREQLGELVAHAASHPLANPVETMPLADAQTAHARLAAGDVAGRIVLVTGGGR